MNAPKTHTGYFSTKPYNGLLRQLFFS